jgi:hypothetical protein
MPLQEVLPTEDNIKFLVEQLHDGAVVFIPTECGYILTCYYSVSPEHIRNIIRDTPLTLHEKASELKPIILTLGSHESLPLILGHEKWNPQENLDHQPLYSLLSNQPGPLIVEYNDRRVASFNHPLYMKLMSYSYSPLWGFELIGLISPKLVKDWYSHVPGYLLVNELYNNVDLNPNNEDPNINGRDATILQVKDGRIHCLRHGSFLLSDLSYADQGVLLKEADDEELVNKQMRLGLLFKSRNVFNAFINETGEISKEEIFKRGIYVDPLGYQKNNEILRAKYMGYVTFTNKGNIDEAEENFYKVVWKSLSIKNMIVLIFNLKELPTDSECLLRHMIVRFCDIVY